ncbi:MAG: sensor histidine kinase [Bryobacteraceae bacterium]
MPGEERPRPRCFLALPYSSGFQRIRKAVETGVEKANFRAVALDKQPVRFGSLREALLGELARADCVVADLTDRNSNVFYELGLAQAMGKGLFLLVESSAVETVPFDFRGTQLLAYERTPDGLSELAGRLTGSLREFRHSPRRSPRIPGSRLTTPFFVEWDNLDHSEAENLCRELLAQMGYQRLDWDKESREFDLIAELPRKDPDGFEYRELWFVAMGRNAPPEMLLDMASQDPGYFLHRFLRDERLERLFSRGGGDVPITLLVILLRGELSAEEAERLRIRSPMRMKGGPYPISLRVRVWDRTYLTNLVQQFPQIGYKYFSDEGRSRSKFHKTPEELYRENVDLTNRQATLIAALEDEKNRRVRAERDAIWKDISFSAAHKIGNPIFAIETNLDPLQKRVIEQRTVEAVEVIGSIRASIENAKGIVDQFKSLTRAQKVSLVSMTVRPLLEDACKVPRNQGVLCEIDCPPDLRIEGDPDRLAECFDELAANSLHWMAGPERKIQVSVIQPAPTPLPQSLDTSRRYALIQFKDNGVGVPLESKMKVFDAFFSTRHHGTGLGLAVVRRIIEGHGGLILESGRPGEGANFEIYLQLSGETAPAVT